MLHNADGNLTGFNYDGSSFSSLPFRAAFVTYVKNGYREYRNSDGSGGWGGSTAYYGQYADNGSNQNTREVAIPWSAITGGGIPSSFVFFGYLTSSGGYVYGQAPTRQQHRRLRRHQRHRHAVLRGRQHRKRHQHAAILAGAAGGFSAADKAGFFHDTFDPFYRDQEGAVPENTPVTLRFRTLHSSGIWSVNVRAYMFDTASGTTTGPVDTDMPFDQNITISGTEYDVWKTTLDDAVVNQVYYYKFHIYRVRATSDQRLVQRRLSRRQRQRAQRRNRRGQRRRTLPVVPVHGLRSQLPDAGMAAERQRLSHPAGPLPQRRPDQRLLPHADRPPAVRRSTAPIPARSSTTTRGTRRCAIRATAVRPATTTSPSSITAIWRACRASSTTFSRSGLTPST